MPNLIPSRGLVPTLTRQARRLETVRPRQTLWASSYHPVTLLKSRASQGRLRAQCTLHGQHRSLITSQVGHGLVSEEIARAERGARAARRHRIGESIWRGWQIARLRRGVQCVRPDSYNLRASYDLLLIACHIVRRRDVPTAIKCIILLFSGTSDQALSTLPVNCWLQGEPAYPVNVFVESTSGKACFWVSRCRRPPGSNCARNTWVLLVPSYYTRMRMTMCDCADGVCASDKMRNR